MPEGRDRGSGIGDWGLGIRDSKERAIRHAHGPASRETVEGQELASDERRCRSTGCLTGHENPPLLNFCAVFRHAFMSDFSRPSGRAADQLRVVRFERGFTRHAEGSVLVSFGDTRVLCTASVENRVPGFLRGKGEGWVTAEYGMLPRATNTRNDREAARGKQGGRTLEIQRLIGRSLRACVDRKALGERTITLDCDVLQADGGTRTAAITGAYVALVDAIGALRAKREITRDPVHGAIAAVSVGVYRGVPVLDLDYAEDSDCDTDMNVVMNDGGGFIEVQGTAEGHAFRRTEMDAMLQLAEAGVAQLVALQREALAG